MFQDSVIPFRFVFEKLTHSCVRKRPSPNVFERRNLIKTFMQHSVTENLNKMVIGRVIRDPNDFLTSYRLGIHKKEYCLLQSIL